MKTQDFAPNRTRRWTSLLLTFSMVIALTITFAVPAGAATVPAAAFIARFIRAYAA